CEHEEGESGEIARFTFVIAHIAQRVEVNQRPDAGNDEQHQSAQIIEDKRERNSEHPANIDPSELTRRDVDLAEDRATADKTSENNRDRDRACDILPAPIKQTNHPSQTDGQE